MTRPTLPIEDGYLHPRWLPGPFLDPHTPANRLRWNPWLMPVDGTDFIDGIVTVAGNGDPNLQTGVAVHVYSANASMTDRYLLNTDGEMLIVPQIGGLCIMTELGSLDVSPGEIALLPRGIHFKVELVGKAARRYVCENYGAPFRLPELGPIGSNGLANARDFLAPVASFEDTGQVRTVISLTRLKRRWRSCLKVGMHSNRRDRRWMQQTCSSTTMPFGMASSKVKANSLWQAEAFSQPSGIPKSTIQRLGNHGVIRRIRRRRVGGSDASCF